MTAPNPKAGAEAPQGPREELILRMFFLFLDVCEALGREPDDLAPSDAAALEQERLAILTAIGVDTSLTEAREFLQADNWHRESARMDVLALRLLFRDHNRLQAAIELANAKRPGRRRVA